MKKNKIVGSLALMILGSSPAFAAENKAADFQASAEIENTCLIEADDVNFGQVYAPLTQQGTKSEMRVLCSKNTPYTIDLAYGGVYGSGTSPLYSVEVYTKATDLTWTEYKIFKNGEAISPYSSDIQCWAHSNPEYHFNVTNANALVELHTLGYNNLNQGYQSNSFDICSQSNKALLDLNVINNWGTSSAYNYGIMAGASKGDSLAYRITVPGDINKVWNTGNGSYKATASGEFDKIEVNAQIVPTNSSSLYPAQDSYFDTVTAVISY